MNAISRDEPTQGRRFDAVVVGGGPAGATAAHDLARAGRSVLLLDRGGRVKPCGGAIPPRLIEEFAIPDRLLVARITAARMIAPSAREADMPIHGGFVGMVDRCVFDEWLRLRAEQAGAERRRGCFERLARDADGTAVVQYRTSLGIEQVRAGVVIGADGARSAVGLQSVPGVAAMRYVFAFHEIVRSPAPEAGFDGARCDVYYDGRVSPDFYGWVFPHGATTSIGLGSARKGFGQREALRRLRGTAGLAGAETIRREGAPIPMQPLRRWDDGRDVLLAGDAAGVVAPASGEGIYYAMTGGRLAAEAAEAFLRTGDARAWFGIPAARDDAALLVCHRQPARTLRRHLPRSGRAGADLGRLHDQETGAGQARRASSHLLQEYRPSHRDRLRMKTEILISSASVAGVLGLGGALTRIGPWYEQLRKPSWQPPGWLFGPAWTGIGILTACSGVSAWRGARHSGSEASVIALFAANGALNILWSALFFTCERPDWALAEVAPLWLSIAALMAAVAPHSPRAALLLAPYLAWVSFAAVLNLTIVRLNAPFGSASGHPA